MRKSILFGALALASAGFNQRAEAFQLVCVKDLESGRTSSAGHSGQYVLDLVEKTYSYDKESESDRVGSLMNGEVGEGEIEEIRHLVSKKGKRFTVFELDGELHSSWTGLYGSGPQLFKAALAVDMSRLGKPRNARLRSRTGSPPPRGSNRISFAPLELGYNWHDVEDEQLNCAIQD